MTRLLHLVAEAVASVPGQVWAVLLAVTLVGTAAAFPFARRAAYKAGQRTAGHEQPASGRDRALFVAAMVPAALFLAMVFTGSFRGLVAFGRDTLHWHNGWEYLVPGTLDGSAVAFAFLAFRAVRKRRSPDRAQRVVWGAAASSAVINFLHEAGGINGSILGGGYLALLSLLGMVMFHELLDQFVEGTEWIQRVNPKFGVRWLTWPTNTVCAAIAWRNWPPATGTPTTVAAAVTHLDEVRARKRGRRRTRDREAAALGMPGWTRLTPWVRARRFAAVLDVERANAAALLQAERTSTAALVEAERAAAEQARQEAEHHRLHAVHMAEQVAAERAERAHASRAERHLHAVEQAEQAEQTAGAPRSTTPKMTDEQALQALLDANGAPDYGWTQREVRRITGAGPERANKLITALAEHHRSSTGAPEQDRTERSA